MAASATIGGLGIQPASAECTVNAGFLGAHCSNGDCFVNLTSCEGGACMINMGDCINGDDALICLNMVCDGAVWREDSVGVGCGFLSDNDDTGVINNDPKNQIGVIVAGPWIVSDTLNEPVWDVVITCTVQVNNDTQGAGGVSRRGISEGNIGVLANTISYFAQPTDSVYLCTKVEWNSPHGHAIIYDDADNDSSNGYQCALATSTE